MFQKIKQANGYLLPITVPVPWRLCRSTVTDHSHPRYRSLHKFGKGADTARQETAHVHSTIFSPDEKFLLAADLGTDEEHVYAFSPVRISRSQSPGIRLLKLQPGTGPRHIAFHPDKPDVYILGELSGTVDAFHFDSNTGKLNHFQRIRSTPEHFNGDPGSADIHIRADGKFLYASNRGTSIRWPYSPLKKMENFP